MPQHDNQKSNRLAPLRTSNDQEEGLNQPGEPYSPSQIYQRKSKASSPVSNIVSGRSKKIKVTDSEDFGLKS